MSSADTSIEIVFNKPSDCRAIYALFKSYKPNSDWEDGYAKQNVAIEEAGFIPFDLFSQKTASFYVEEQLYSQTHLAKDTLLLKLTGSHRIGYALVSELFKCFDTDKVKTITSAQENDSSFFWSFSCRIDNDTYHLAAASEDLDRTVMKGSASLLAFKELCIDGKVQPTKLEA